MSGWAELRKLPREIWLLNAANVINRMGSMAFVFFGIYLTKHLGYTPEIVGMLLALFGLGNLLITPLGGWLCDKFSPKGVMIVSLIAHGTFLLIFPFFKALPVIFIMTVVVSMASEAFWPASMTYSTLTIPGDLKKASLALNRLAHNLGMSVGPVLGGFLAAISFKWVFWVDGITSLLAASILGLFLFNRRLAEKTEAPSYFRNLRLLFRDRDLRYFLIACVPLGVGWFQFTTTLPIFLVRDLGLSEANYGMLFSINTLMIVFLEVPLTLGIMKWSAPKTLALSAGLFGIGYLILLGSMSLWGVVAMVIVNTFGEMLCAPTGGAYVSDISPKGREGSYMGIYSSSFGICVLLAPLFGTWMYAHFGSTGLWASTAFLCFISAALYLRMRPARLNVQTTP